ncbi:uncharacterized protein LOC112500047 [Cynara cardunculus var. scolymus]|nr:uncharacterized protein LOC112500047 [Cynara cardunculus var. scolymus]
MAITSITSWFTPTVLFCVLNLMIAIIFIASNFKSPHHPPQNLQGELVRSPSLLERVKSVNFSSFYATTPESHDITGYNSMGQLSRPPSFLQRVKSIDLSFSSFYAPPIGLQSHDLHDSEQTHYDLPSQLTRVPSLLERVKSFKLPSPFNSDHHSGVGDISFTKDELSDMDRDPHHEPIQDDNVTNDEPETVDVTPAKKPRNSITKSRSEKRMPESDDDEDKDKDKDDVDRRRPATMKAAIGGKDECVDAKADDFIKRFKQQLKLQRLESLQRFREMLNRGTSA